MNKQFLIALAVLLLPVRAYAAEDAAGHAPPRSTAMTIERLLMKPLVRESDLPRLEHSIRQDHAVKDGISCEGRWYLFEKEAFMISRTACAGRTLGFWVFRIKKKEEERKNDLLLAAAFYDSDGDGEFERVHDTQDRPLPHWIRDHHRTVLRERVQRHLAAGGKGPAPPVGSYLQLAGDLVQVNDIPALREVASRAIALYDDQYKLYELRAGAYYEEKEYEKAAADAGRAIELKPSEFMPYYLRGNALNLLDRGEEALADLSRVLELKPDLAEAYRLRGEVQEKLGRPEEAIADYTRTLELDPDDC